MDFANIILDLDYSVPIYYDYIDEELFKLTNKDPNKTKPETFMSFYL